MIGNKILEVLILERRLRMELNGLVHFDDKLKNILFIKENGFTVEAIILIFSYLDYLSEFTDKSYDDNNHNRANFRNFLMNYSDEEKILKHIQVDVFYRHCEMESDYKLKYKKYLDKISGKLTDVKQGKNIVISEFFSLDEVETEDKKFFRRYTLVNRLYDFRNFAIHEYRNKFEKDLDVVEPTLLYINRLSGKGNFILMFPFEFLYRILINCYRNVMDDYSTFLKENLYFIEES